MADASGFVYVICTLTDMNNPHSRTELTEEYGAFNTEKDAQKCINRNWISFAWVESRVQEDAEQLIKNACKKHDVKLNERQSAAIVRYINGNPHLDAVREVNSLVKTAKEYGRVLS